MTEVIIVKNEREAGDIYGRFSRRSHQNQAECGAGTGNRIQSARRYQSLARIVHSEHIDVSQVRGFALDEYLGLAA